MNKQPKLVRTIEEFRTAIRSALLEAQAKLDAAAVAGEPSSLASLGFVPTMGALHSGHASLMARAAEQNEVVVASVFVNPLQFGPGEDYDKYPRTLQADLEAAGQAGIQILFAPENSEMYPDEAPLVTVSSGHLGTLFEGKTRPGHFDGMLTVVNKFFNIISAATGQHPFNAYFGQKDAQQLVLIQRMVHDFNHAVTIKPVPIVREDNGLALSSRNQFLKAEERQAALVLSRTLALLREQGVAHGVDTLDLDGARQRINSTEGVRLDYLEVIDPLTFKAPESPQARALGLVAAYVGETRLIDNMELN